MDSLEPPVSFRPAPWRGNTSVPGLKSLSDDALSPEIAVHGLRETIKSHYLDQQTGYPVHSQCVQGRHREVSPMYRGTSLIRNQPALGP